MRGGTEVVFQYKGSTGYLLNESRFACLSGRGGEPLDGRHDAGPRRRRQRWARGHNGSRARVVGSDGRASSPALFRFGRFQREVDFVNGCHVRRRLALFQPIQGLGANARTARQIGLS